MSAGVLMVGAQLVMLPFDPDDHVATSTAVTFQVGGVAYLMGFVALVLWRSRWRCSSAARWATAHSWRRGAFPSVSQWLRSASA